MELKTDKRLERIITDAIQRQLSKLTLPPEINLKDVKKHIRVCMRYHPEIFWFSHQYKLDTTTQTLYFYYNFTPQKKDFYAKEIKKVIEYLFQPNALKHLSDIEKVTYVYKWIANNTTYNEYSSFNQTIFSVLINRNSVCTGYAKTAQFLLNILGIQSELVFGKFHADNSITGRHGWNIVKINGDWYHIDFCLADPSLKYLLNEDESPIEYDGLIWNYFCRPTEYILKNRSIEFLEYYPICNKGINTKLAIPLVKPLKQFEVCKSESGTSAIVYLDSLNKTRVIKIPRENYDLIEHEFKILEILQGCKHIVRLEGKTHSGLLLEQLTPLSELLNSHYYHPNEGQLKHILIQLAQGLIECRERGITYSDIHYNNVFVTKDGIYKWGDFGIAYPTTSDGKMPSIMIGNDGVALGSRWFMAPETYRDGIFTESSAIYSLAMLAYFVMNDMRPPYWNKDIDEVETLRLIHITNTEIPTPRYGNVNLWEFLKGVCLCKDQDNRIPSLENFRDALERDLLYSDLHQILLALKRSQLKAKLLSGDKIALKAACGDLVGNPVDKSKSISFPKGKLARDKQQNNNEDFDIDAFASTNYQPSYIPHKDQPMVDIDSYAQTCGFKQTPRDCPNLSDSATSFYPSNSKIIWDEKSPRKKFGIGSMVGSNLNLFGGLFTGLATGASAVNLDDNIEESDDISTCLYAPSEILPNKSFIIRVYMYLPNEQDAIDSKVKEIDPKAIKKEYKPLDIPVKNGDRLTIQLDLSDGVECKNGTKTVIWRGHYTDCSFMAKLIDASQESIEGTAYIFVDDVPAGEMLFTIDVVDTKPRELYTRVESHRFSKIFISYAHQDESQVRGIAEGCRMLGKDYFFDRHSLQAGDIFKDKILDYINNADLFVLCWSKNAAQSEWVQIEREHALQLIYEGKSTLSIYPISLSPEAPLPGDMSDKYNFGKL